MTDLSFFLSQCTKFTGSTFQARFSYTRIARVFKSPTTSSIVLIVIIVSLMAEGGEEGWPLCFEIGGAIVL